MGQCSFEHLQQVFWTDGLDNKYNFMAKNVCVTGPSKIGNEKCSLQESMLVDIALCP